MTAYFSNVFASSRAGSYTFNNSVTSSLIGNAYASFLLGIPDSTGLATVKNPDTFSYGSSYAFYAQDDWKPTSRLTVNYRTPLGISPRFQRSFQQSRRLPAGLLLGGQRRYRARRGGRAGQRHEVDQPGFRGIHRADADHSPPAQAKVPQSMHYSQKTSFAPRVGFAWRPFGDDKTVIRGGVGRYVETLLSALITAGWAVEASEVGSYTNSIVNGKAALSFPYAFPVEPLATRRRHLRIRQRAALQGSLRHAVEPDHRA